jgi:hypothetical protein
MMIGVATKINLGGVNIFGYSWKPPTMFWRSFQVYFKSIVTASKKLLS